MKSSMNLMKSLFVVFLTSLIFSSAGVAAEEENQTEVQAKKVTLKPIVVTATKTEESIEEVASSVTVVSSQDIDNAKDMTVKQALQEVPGLFVTGEGGLGRRTSVFIRGARSEDTLVMMDGMEINDPISPGRAFNFSDLLTDNIDRIEVVRGPQSTLYGSDAIGGVVNIITKKGTGKPKFSLFTEGGSDETVREILSGDGKIGRWDYSFSGARVDSNGVSADDNYEDNAFSGRIGYQLFEKGNLDFVFRSVDAKVHLDDLSYSTYRTINDPNYTEETNSQLYLARYTQQIADFWDTILKFGYYTINRDDRDKPDNHEPFYSSKGWYDSSIIKGDWQNNWYIGDIDEITMGLEYKEERGESDYHYSNYYPDFDFWDVGESRFPKKKVNNKAFYFQNQLKLFDRFFLTGGVRVDDHEMFGTETTYKVALAYLIRPTGTKFKGTWGTGFKAPSLYQLYAPSMHSYPWTFVGGNPDLDPEESKSFDVGIEQNLFDERLSLSFVYFHNDYKKYITYISETFPNPFPLYPGDDYLYVDHYDNLNKAEAKGFEAGLGINPCENLTFSANYTRTDTRDKKNGGQLLRRPKHLSSLSANYIFQKNLQLNLILNYVGERVDVGNKIAKSYTRVDLAGSYTINEHFQLFSRIEDLFNEHYQETYGYDAAGISAFGGVKLSF
jgi:Outer membrane cobalamin receptor protein